MQVILAVREGQASEHEPLLLLVRPSAWAFFPRDARYLLVLRLRDIPVAELARIRLCTWVPTSSTTSIDLKGEIFASEHLLQTR